MGAQSTFLTNGEQTETFKQKNIAPIFQKDKK